MLHVSSIAPTREDSGIFPSHLMMNCHLKRFQDTCPQPLEGTHGEKLIAFFFLIYVVSCEGVIIRTRFFFHIPPVEFPTKDTDFFPLEQFLGFSSFFFPTLFVALKQWRVSPLRDGEKF